MTARDFAYWLQGFYELHGFVDGFSEAQAETIRRHLMLVFKHEIDPSFGGEAQQQALNAIHNPAGNLTINPTINPTGLTMRC